jgi:transglutaminase-like putative cysteine protease
MKIRFGYRLEFYCPQATPMILMLHAHPSRIHDLIRPDNMRLDPRIPVRIYHDDFGNTCTRIEAPAGLTTISTDAVIKDSGLPEPEFPMAQEHPINILPEDTLVYLLPSRHCDTQEMMEDAWRLFGQVKPGWQRVRAIRNFAHEQLKFGAHWPHPREAAWRASVQQQGVRRAAVHLAITLCRCLNIPARYCTGYLGDIGVPASDGRQDFAGWFEAYLGGAWHTFDPMNNQRRIGRILLARGRDASDVAISATFGQNTLQSFRVWTDEVKHVHPIRSVNREVEVEFGHA